MYTQRCFQSSVWNLDSSRTLLGFTFLTLDAD